MPRQSKSIQAALPEREAIDIRSLAAACRNGQLDLVTVLGPTASGKTKYAVRLAREIGSAEIISADSRQVYRGMDIGTGKDLSDYGPVPYHLIDIADPGEGYNVFRFRQDFQAAYDDIRSRGAFPILCGGTGLYLNSVLSDYDFSSRKPLSAPPAQTSAAGLPAAIAGPEKRGNGPSMAQAAPAEQNSKLTGNSRRDFVIGTLVDRDTRNARIDSRLDSRLQEGMVEEIKGLLDGGVSAETLLGYGLEYKFVTQYILGEMSYAQMRERLSTAIHQFAKRQMTWLRGMERSGIRIHWVEI